MPVVLTMIVLTAILLAGGWLLRDMGRTLDKMDAASKRRQERDRREKQQ